MDASIGRKADLQEPVQERLEYAPYRPLHREREYALAARRSPLRPGFRRAKLRAHASASARFRHRVGLKDPGADDVKHRQIGADRRRNSYRSCRCKRELATRQPAIRMGVLNLRDRAGRQRDKRVGVVAITLPFAPTSSIVTLTVDAETFTTVHA